MGTNVDCYQRAEGRYRLMPGIIAALRDAANPFSILTKGTLILRDLDLLADAAEVTDVGLNVSVGFTDTDLWRSVEPGTPSPERRLEVCAALTGARPALRRADGPGAAVPHRLPRPSWRRRSARLAAAGRGARDARSCCTCGPAPGVVHAPGSARSTRPCCRATAALYGNGCLRPAAVSAADRRPGARAGRPATVSAGPAPPQARRIRPAGRGPPPRQAQNRACGGGATIRRPASSPGQAQPALADQIGYGHRPGWTGRPAAAQARKPPSRSVAPLDARAPAGRRRPGWRCSPPST